MPGGARPENVWIPWAGYATRGRASAYDLGAEVRMIAGGIATLYVTDMDRSVRFYVEQLGLRLKVRHGNGWAEIDAGDGLVIGLHGLHPGAPPVSGSGSTSLGLRCSAPIDDVYRALGERGVSFRGPVRKDSTISIAHFADPDGNALYICA